MIYKYCPVCAGELKTKSSSCLVCQKCGFEFFQNSKPTASGLFLNEKQEVLLLKRAISPSLGKWDTPGGFLENGEDPIDGLRREMREELSLEIELGPILTIFIDHYGKNEDVVYTFNVFYEAKILSDDIKLDHENSEYKWFAKDDIPWNDLAFQNTHHALHALYK